MTTDFDPLTPIENHSSPGKILRDAREQLGLSQQEVAIELFMTLTKVKAIESDQYNRLHSDTFIRGYLRAYAQLVKVDLTSLMSIYDGQAKILGLKEEFIPIKQEASTKKFWQFVAMSVGVLLLVYLVSVWFLNNRKSDYSNLTLSSIENTPETRVTKTKVDDADNASLYSASTAAANLQNTESKAESGEATATQDGELPHKLPTSGKGNDHLDFYFQDECWVEVSDANGDVLVTELQLKDSKLTLNGQSPFEVKLGNAPAVSLKINGEDVNLVPALGTNVLTLKVSRKSDN